jgi:hypothetical protein
LVLGREEEDCLEELKENSKIFHGKIDPTRDNFHFQRQKVKLDLLYSLLVLRIGLIFHFQMCLSLHLVILLCILALEEFGCCGQIKIGTEKFVEGFGWAQIFEFGSRINFFYLFQI